MTNIFSTNNRDTRVAELKHTIKGLSAFMPHIMETPMIVTNYGSLQDKGPYYLTNRQLSFYDQLKTGKGFFILLNKFNNENQVIENHMMAGYMRQSGVIELFDPNGDIRNEGIYSMFNGISVYDILKSFFKKAYPRRRITIKPYTGDMIVCPNIENSCVYRSIFFLMVRHGVENMEDAVRGIKNIILQKTIISSITEITKQAHSFQTKNQGSSLVHQIAVAEIDNIQKYIFLSIKA